ncbi:hypothetical protein DSM104299_04427 [Baekduia alba]|uniref:hypothetical protein n=1 Tax=Baekduia alba TaxID=2997333 RepID=UPI0023412081|nr:hypothetical protein [Baekduia alba]WCB95678.1 hypothetical protein DSM104299_04427 [Baekduia alba]
MLTSSHAPSRRSAGGWRRWLVQRSSTAVEAATVNGEELAPALAPLTRLASEVGYSVAFERRYGAEDGGVVWETRTISINNRVSSNRRVRALVSILALLIEIEEREGTALDLSYTEEALVVDSIAFTVWRTIGLDTETSAPAMSSWPQASPETIERAADMVDKVAARIEKHLIPAR